MADIVPKPPRKTLKRGDYVVKQTYFEVLQKIVLQKIQVTRPVQLLMRNPKLVSDLKLNLHNKNANVSPLCNP